MSYKINFLIYAFKFKYKKSYIILKFDFNLRIYYGVNLYTVYK